MSPQHRRSRARWASIRLLSSFALAVTAVGCGNATADPIVVAEAAPAPTAVVPDGPADGQTDTRPSPTAASNDPTAPTSAVQVPEALQFIAPLVGGGTFDGAEYAGRTVALWFWAPT
jgi:hypothetical protein